MMSDLSVGSGLSLEPGSENIIWQTFKMLLLVSRLGFRLESGVGRGKLSGNVLTRGFSHGLMCSRGGAGPSFH